MKSGEQVLILTAKGTEELRNHASQLDASARNILSSLKPQNLCYRRHALRFFANFGRVTHIHKSPMWLG
jgi:hypothetical protein